MTLFINLLLVLEALVALLMMLVILMQRPKSEGLGAAFGGGVTENIFGAQTTNVLTTITTWLASIFFIIILALSMLYAHRGAPNSALRRELMKTSGPAKAAAPLPAKVAAEKAAADAKAKLAPVPQGSVAPGAGTASSPGAAAAAVGVVPAGAPVATPAASARPSP
ncbi:MAG TPA: preprotein translocase subunit SecG [Chthoniobacterales bacterium]|jgi:preprotein translocase subunit SecG|nr:preprotein translocase subunit SecG [Chthoniobacterales bacterium]